MKIRLVKTFVFCLLVIVFTTISFVIRNILVQNFNGYTFKIITIDHLNNYGAAFSILQNHTVVLICVSIVILLAALHYIFKNIENLNKFDIFLTSILSAGIMGNLIERIADGYVTDYFRLNFISFPIFNTSDLFICIGAFVLICNILFNDERNK